MLGNTGVRTGHMPERKPQSKADQYREAAQARKVTHRQEVETKAERHVLDIARIYDALVKNGKCNRPSYEVQGLVIRLDNELKEMPKPFMRSERLYVPN